MDKIRIEKIKKEYEDFKSGYKKRIKIGLIMMTIVPLSLLVLMFSMESKLLFLTLWIFSVIAIAAYLIWLDYTMERLSGYFEPDLYSDLDTDLDLELEAGTTVDSDFGIDSNHNADLNPDQAPQTKLKSNPKHEKIINVQCEMESSDENDR